VFWAGPSAGPPTIPDDCYFRAAPAIVELPAFSLRRPLPPKYPKYVHCSRTLAAVARQRPDPLLLCGTYPSGLRAGKVGACLAPLRPWGPAAIPGGGLARAPGLAEQNGGRRGQILDVGPSKVRRARLAVIKRKPSEKGGLERATLIWTRPTAPREPRKTTSVLLRTQAAVEQIPHSRLAQPGQTIQKRKKIGAPKETGKAESEHSGANKRQLHERHHTIIHTRLRRNMGLDSDSPASGSGHPHQSGRKGSKKVRTGCITCK
jgi:hypothetical protein